MTFFLVLLFVVLVTAWAVRHALTQPNDSRFSGGQANLLLRVAEFPGLVKLTYLQIKQQASGDPLALLLERNVTQQKSWVRHFPEEKDSGYMLFSGVSPVVKHSVVQLIRISDGAILATWDPDWNAINEKTTDKKHAPKGSAANLQAVHPLLLPGGDIIFNTGGALVRMTPCDAKPLWVLDTIAHHSNEFAESDSTLWVPSIAEDGFSENPWLQNKLRDDSLARVSTNGVVLENRSFARILRDNGLEVMLLGRGYSLNEDPIHLNQIKTAKNDTRYWKKGDLLISTRHLSTVFLYRPSTNTIVWHQTGPWKNQHSADFVDGHRISVFDNNLISGIPNEHSFILKGDTNHVYTYDFETKKSIRQFEKLIAAARPLTFSGGRAQMLADGGLFIEETDYGRHLRFTKDKLLWSRVNDYDAQRIGVVSWSRYMTAEEVEIPLRALASKSCKWEG